MADDTSKNAQPKSVQITIVSCFRFDATYAKSFLLSLPRFPSSIKFKVYHHDGPLPAYAPKLDNVEYIDLGGMEDRKEFREKFNGMDGTMSGQLAYNWRTDALKFSNKVFAMLHASLDASGWLIWLDADTAVKNNIPDGWLEKFLDADADIVTLERKAVPYSETSFLAINLDKAPARHLLADLGDTYMNGELFHYREWHDGFVFERLYRLHKMHGLRGKSLYDGDKMEAFDNSPLAEYMVHRKGEKKNIFGRRYTQLLNAIRYWKPKSIIEVGTWNGQRAVEMARTALEYCDEVHYDGFDLFEDSTPEKNKEEFNTKPSHTIKAVNNMLKLFADEMAKRGKKFTFSLTKGDSRETLRGHEKSWDFAYIDGGHSPETTLSDYENLKDTPVIMVDDYFTEDDAGMGPDESECGTNALVESGKIAGDIHILNSEDQVIGGGITHMVLIVGKGVAIPNFTQVMAPFVVVPKDCVEKDDLKDNILKNMELIEKWVEKCKPHEDLGIIASAGPSLKKTMPMIKSHVENGNPMGGKARVLAVKHSYPTLVEAGIVPWGCVVLDPRSINGVSTHGIVRKKLFTDIHPDTLWFVASMTNPEVTEYLLSEGAKVYGWHAFTGSSLRIPELRGQTMIMGGTCAAMRSVGVLHHLGFRKMHMHGFDSCLDGPPTDPKEMIEEGKPKYLRVEMGGKEFWTTGELVAQAQDFEKLLEREDVDYELSVFGEGIIPEMWKSARKIEPPSYEELLK